MRFTLRDFPITFGGPDLVLIAGPCVIESADHASFMAERLRDLCQQRGVPFVFKASFDKANRTSIHSFRGPGFERGLEILAELRERLQVPVLSDIHEPAQAEPAARVLDLLQIPAFLCRQTDLLRAAAKTGKPVNVKKGQFLAPDAMTHVVDKLEQSACKEILLTERGTAFGYGDLVVDYRSLVRLRSLGHPLVFDATHSVQRPGADGAQSGGAREFIKPLARAAVAVGIDALFLEVHDNPDEAKSDAASMLALKDLPALLDTVLALHRAIPQG